MSINLLNQGGDTIVEVLLATVIVTAIIVAAAATSRHNTAATLDTQEHSQALRAAQQEVEILRYKGATAGSDVCFTTAALEVAHANTAPQCLFLPNGPGTQPRFRTEIFKPGFAPNTSSNYEVRVTWPTAINTTGNVTLYYTPPKG